MGEETNAGTVRAGYSTPLLHVRSIERSLRFYEPLGFAVVDTDRGTPLGWARLHCAGGAIMLLRADEPLAEEGRGVLLYLYTPDLAGLRTQLVAQGFTPTPIRHPAYMPSGEMLLTDPDGFVVLVGHWGESEHAAWLERIGRKK